MNTNVPSGPLFNWTQAIYALHAFSLLTGILGAATVVGAFLTGWPSIIAVILNYVKRSEVRGTWLESHFRWQIRTFWYGLLWVVLCVLFVVLTLGIGILIAWLPLAIVSLWFVYRIVRGWMALAGTDAVRCRYADPEATDGCSSAAEPALVGVLSGGPDRCCRGAGARHSPDKWI